MTYLDSIILGIVEGVTEFLPVSSTGHLILASSLLGIPQSEFVKSFEIIIQLGAILAVVVMYFKSFFDIEVLKRLAVAFIPTGIIGYLGYKLVKDVFFGNNMIVIGALFVGGIAIIAIEAIMKDKEVGDGDIRTISYKQAALVGFAQALAVIPGISRSGATIMGGLLLKIPRATILTFSFLLAVPTMLAATGYDLIKNPAVFNGANFSLLLVGFVVSFIVALAVIHLALSYIRKRSFAIFGIYRILVAIVFVFILYF